MALPSDTLPAPAAVCVPRGEPLGVNFAARPKTGERDILDRSNGREGYIVVVISVQKDSDGCGSLTDGVVAKVSAPGGQRSNVHRRDSTSSADRRSCLPQNCRLADAVGCRRTLPASESQPFSRLALGQ